MRILRFIFRAALLLTLAIVIAGGLLVFQMSNGSLSAGFLKDRLVAAVEQRMPDGSQVEIDDLLVSFGPQWNLIVESRGVSLGVRERGRIEAGDTRAEFPLLPLLKGSAEPVSVNIDDLLLEIAKQPAAAPAGSRSEYVRALLNDAARAVRGAGRRLGDSGLQRIDITNARITGEALQALPVSGELPLQIAALTWRPSESGGDIEVRFQSVHGDWILQGASGADPQGRPFVDFTLTDFPPAYVFPPIADPARRPYYDAIADVEGRMQLDDKGGFDVARMHVTLGTGYLSMLENDAAIIDRVDVAVELSADSDQLKLARSDVRFGGTHIVFRGGLDLAEFGAPILFEAELGQTRLAPFGDAQEPVLLESGAAKGSIDLAAGAIILDQASISGPEGAARAIGSFRTKGLAPGLSGAVTVDETTARMARALWLPVIARKTRDWFDRNVKSALLGPGTVQIALPKKNLGRAGQGRPLPPDGIVGEIAYRYGLFTPLRDLPLVQNAFGSLQFADASAIVKLTQADVTAAGLGTANINATEFRIPELGKPDPVGYLELNMTGPAAALAQLSNAGRLNIAEDRGLSPEGLSGDATLSLTAEFPLTKPARPDSVDADFVLQLADFSSKSPISGQRISRANLAIKGTPTAFSVTGAARIDGIPAKINMASGDDDSKSTVRLTMDEAARKKLGIDLGAYLTGPIVTSVKPQADGRVQDISIDLKSASVSLPFLGWQKGAGVPATFKARIERTAHGTQVRDITVSGDGFQAAGELDIDSDGKLVGLEMRDITLKPSDDFAISAKASGKGYAIELSGASFDARGLISYLQSGPQSLAVSDRRYSISLKLAQVRGFNGVSLSGLAGSGVVAGGTIDKLSLQAGTGAAQPVELVVSEAADERSVVLRSANGGALLRFLNIYDKAFGGDLLLQFEGPRTALNGLGSVSIDNFRVQNEQVFDEAARERKNRSNPDREIRSTDIEIDTTNISFSKLKIPFRKEGSAIVVSEASLRGPVVGASGKGTVDLKGRNLSISGTIVPAYGINNLPGAIPILGQLLGGRKREGLIGITYQMYGPVDGPTLKLNPASAIAPGIFRRIFEY